MERPLGLILTYAFLQILLHSGVRAESETALLEIGLGHKKKINLDNTKCVCDQNQIMSFQIPLGSLPDLSPGDFFASPDLAQKWREELEFAWAENLFDCQGTLQQVTTPSGEKVLEITFAVTRNCGVNLPNGKTPTFLTHKDRSKVTTKESTYYGRVMEGNLQFSYVSPSGEKKHLTALIACECENPNPNLECGADQLAAKITRQPIPGAQITSASVEPWLEKCVKISHVGPEITFDIDVDLKSAREECLFSVTDLGNFHEIAIDFEYNYDFAGAPDLNFTSSLKKDIVCQQKTHWLDWSEWSKCSNGCKQTRVRLCDNGVAGLKGCENNAVEEKICDKQDCPEEEKCPQETIYDPNYHATIPGIQKRCKCPFDPFGTIHRVLIPKEFVAFSSTKVGSSSTIEANLVYVTHEYKVNPTADSFINVFIGSDYFRFDNVTFFQDLTRGIAFGSKGQSFFFARRLNANANEQLVASLDDFCASHDMQRPEIAFEPSCPFFMSSMNHCENGQSGDCKNICDSDTLEIQCSYDGKEITTETENTCGECGVCNQVTFKCENGVKSLGTVACGMACPPCSAAELTSAWADWGACDAPCDGGKRIRTRQLLPASAIKNLDCDASGLNISSISTQESETCNTFCCGYKEVWTSWEVVDVKFLKQQPECKQERSLIVTCDPGSTHYGLRSRNITIKVDYKDTCSDPFDVGTIKDLCDPEDKTKACGSRINSKSEVYEFCSTGEGWCCNSTPRTLPDNCAGRCAFGKVELQQQNCEALVYNLTEEPCRTAKNDFSCECAPSEIQNCVNVTDTCISDTNGAWRKVTKICGSQSDTCEVSEECTPEECTGNDRSNCFTKFSCKLEVGEACKQKEKEFYDQNGNVIQTEYQDCCTTIKDCTKEQVSKLCPPCNTDFPECMEDLDEIICGAGICKNNPDQCQCGDFNCDEKSFELPDIQPGDLEKIHMGFPEDIYGTELRFFISKDMNGYNTPGCFEKFDQSNSSSVLSIEKTYEAAKKCGAHSVTGEDGEETFEATIWVDKYRKDDSDTLTTSTKFAKISCLIPPPAVVDSGFIHAVPRYDPLQIVKVSQPGSSDISFELATDPNFRNILDPNNAQHLANAHLVGEHIYARITGKQPIRLISCEIRSLDAIHEQLSETMIENGCPTNTMKTIFDMKYFGNRQASGNKEIKLSWQNFYFRKIASARQRVSYSCLVKPCFDASCDTDCTKSSRRRRSSDPTDQVQEKSTAIPSDYNAFNLTDSKFDFWIDVYKTLEELQRAREVVAQWERQRSVANVMSKCAIITSAILVVFATILAGTMLRRRLVQARIREEEGGQGPKVLRMKKSQMDRQNNNIGVINPTFSSA